MRALLEDAVKLLQRGLAEQAWETCRPLLCAASTDFETLNVLGTIAVRIGEIERGVELLTQATRQNPNVARVHLNLGSGLQRLGRLKEAIGCYDCAISLKPTMAEAYNHRGTALQEMGQLEEALADLDRAVATNPEYVDAWLNRSLLLRRLGRTDEAFENCGRAIRLTDTNAMVHNAMGCILREKRQFLKAIASFDRAIACRPRYLHAYYNRASALVDIRNFDEALATYDAVLVLQPQSAEAQFGRAKVLSAMNRLQEAVESFRCALRLDAGHPLAAGLLLDAQLKLCDWEHFDTSLAVILDGLQQNRPVVPPFTLSRVSNDPIALRKCAEVWSRTAAPPVIPGPHRISHRHDGRIRIGYFSADFYDHVVGRVFVNCLEKHDASKFDVLAFSYSPKTADIIEQRFQTTVHQFIDIREMSDGEASALARELKIDIAVDLKGLTNDSRLEIFAHRAAPIQASYLGFPGTLGTDYIDYLIADTTVIPESCRHYYREYIVALPESYQLGDTANGPSTHTFTRTELGLPESGVVFCCFNDSSKITPKLFDCWIRILKKVDGAVLWLSPDYPGVATNLSREAAARGVNPSRLIFAPRLPIAQHLSRQCCGDLFLDTAPYNAHATGSYALRSGLPILTICGQTFAGRVGASLLTGVGLPELIMPGLAEYEDRAVFLGRNPQVLQSIREKLSRTLPTASLFDTARFTRSLEAAYTIMYKRHRADLPPDHIRVLPDSAHDGGD